MARKKVFPDELFVIREERVDQPYLVPFEDSGAAVEEVGNGGRVAVYKLVDIGDAEIVRTLKR